VPQKKNKIRDDTDFEIPFFEGILKRSPGFIEAMASLGDLYTKKGLYEKGLKIDERLSYLKPNDPIVLYNLACSYSLLKQIDKALEIVKRAIACGYNDFEHLQADGDLENLRKDTRFQSYYRQLKNEKSNHDGANREKQ